MKTKLIEKLNSNDINSDVLDKETGLPSLLEKRRTELDFSKNKKKN